MIPDPRFPLANNTHQCDWILRGQPGTEWLYCFVCGDEKDADGNHDGVTHAVSLGHAKNGPGIAERELWPGPDRSASLDNTEEH